MINNKYFGVTYSEALNGVKQMGLFLTRDLESLKECGVSQRHLDKLATLTNLAEESGNSKDTVREMYKSTSEKTDVRNQVLKQLNLLESCLNLNSGSVVNAGRTMLLPELRKARTKQFGELLWRLIKQLAEQETDFEKDANIGYWTDFLSSLATKYDQSLIVRSSEKSESVLATSSRAQAYNNMVDFAVLLAKTAKVYWQNNDNPRYRDYCRVKSRKKTASDLPSEQQPAGAPVTAS